MSLNVVTASPDVTAIAEPRLVFSLRKLLPDGPARLTLSKPQPLYTVSAEDVLKNTITKAELPDGWQLLVLREEEPFATVEIRIERHGGTESYHYAGVMQGAYTYSIYEALGRADEIGSDPAVQYELRILRAPTVYLYAVWLHATDKDRIIPCAPAPRALAANQERSPDEVCEALRELAEYQTSHKHRSTSGA